MNKKFFISWIAVALFHFMKSLLALQHFVEVRPEGLTRIRVIQTVRNCCLQIAHLAAAVVTDAVE